MLIKKNLKAVTSISGLILFAVNAQSVMQFVQNALIICYKNIIPSLYIFMIFSNYISQGELQDIFSMPLMWYSNLLKIKDRKYSSYLILSLIGGFAIGANFLKKLENSDYPQNALKAISPSLINNSFSFCVFAVGIGYLDNFQLGLMLFTSLSISSMITSFLLSFVYRYNIVLPIACNEKKQSDFVQSINSAVHSILTICGFVILFYVICEVVSLYMYRHKFLSVTFSTIMEVTSGCVKIIELYGKNSYFICFCLSIIPVSTLCQVYYFTNNKSIIKSLMFSRILHTPISILIFSVLANIFPVAASVANNNNAVIHAYQNNIEISATMFIITVVFIIIFDNNKIFTKFK